MCCVEFYGVTFLFFLDFFFFPPPFRISFASDRPHSLLESLFFFFLPCIESHILVRHHHPHIYFFKSITTKFLESALTEPSCYRWVNQAT